MCAVRQGQQVALSTVFGRRGWYFEAWEQDSSWYQEQITAEQCPRISPAFLEEQRRSMP
jgi:hypothetical protein